MPMILCDECGSSYNDELASECIICANRRVPELLSQAQDPDTGSDELGKLALSPSKEVAEAALANPNTPQWAKNRAVGRGDPSHSEEARATTSAARASSSPDLDHVQTQIMRSQIATMNYVRVLALMVMFLIFQAVMGVVLWIITLFSDPIDGPPGGLVAVVFLVWIGGAFAIGWNIAEAMRSAADSRNRL